MVYGFVTQVHALQFEWAWQNPARSLKTSHLHSAWKKRKLTGAKAQVRPSGAGSHRARSWRRCTAATAAGDLQQPPAARLRLTCAVAAAPRSPAAGLMEHMRPEQWWHV